jgi:hypothetical protein
MKRLTTLATLVVSAATLVWFSPAASGQTDSFNTLPFGDIVTGYKISPVPMNTTGRDAFLAGWGSYLVNAVSGCIDCHTNPPFADGGNPYQGQPAKINAAAYLGGGVAFGPFTSRNITPDSAGLPAGLTFDQFQQAMSAGADAKKLHPQMGPLLQVMPWPVYAKMSPRQLRAIYEYLSSIPSVK